MKEFLDGGSLPSPNFRLVFNPFHKTHKVAIFLSERLRENVAFPVTVSDVVIVVVGIVVFIHILLLLKKMKKGAAELLPKVKMISK